MAHAAATSLSRDPIGTRPLLGRYQLLERIGSGGMAELYRAKLLGAAGFERELAVKKVLPHLAGDTSFVHMLKNEARIAASLSHVNVVAVLDFSRVDDQYFLVMEYVDGPSLQNLLSASYQQDEPVRFPVAAWIMREVCKGLDYIHRKRGPDGRCLGIVHRDISPENILISCEGEVKIIDFGIARAVDRTSHTRHGVVKGKVAYLSPEQLAGGGADHRADIYAAGVVLYELLTGRLPFEGRTDLVTIARIRRGEFPRAAEVNPLVPARLEGIAQRAMAKDLRDRFQSAADMACALEDYLYTVGDRTGTRVIADFARRKKEFLDEPHQPAPRDDTAVWARQARESSVTADEVLMHVVATPCTGDQAVAARLHDEPTDLHPPPGHDDPSAGRWTKRLLAAAIGLLLGLVIVLACYRPRAPEAVWPRARFSGSPVGAPANPAARPAPEPDR